jgi:hypothetical protein
MSSTITNPLEAFVRDYVETAGGLWEQVEPQVYDLLPPSPSTDAPPITHEEMLRICFDPEALPEHPGSQFCTLGTPLVDHLLHGAQTRGQFARAWVSVANLQPFDLDRRVRRSLQLPDGVGLTLGEPRVTDVVINAFWFAAVYDSDQKEQDLLCVAIERQRGREVRHLDQLLQPDRLDESLMQEHPPVEMISLIDAFDGARRQALRTATATTGRRLRELRGRLDRQRRRIEGYYDDLLAEIDESHARAARLGRDLEKHATRRHHAQQERRIRLTELDRAATLKVQLRLTNLLELHQPKLQLPAAITRPTGADLPLPLTWDPFTETLEPPDCPACDHPSYAIRMPSRPRPDHAAWTCPACAAKLPPRP